MEQNTHKKDVETFFIDYLNNKEINLELKNALEYSFISDGKMFRSLLLFHLLEDFNLNYKDFLEFGCAIEMIHTYSLIHDDLPAMDDDDMRRGKATVHKKFSEHIAILTGDGLLTHAFEIVAQSELEANKKIEIIKLMTDCAGFNYGMINGQVLDMENNQNLTLEQLENIHIQKTSRLIELPIQIALILAGKEDYFKEMKTIAYKIGLLYQIQDDYLDKYGKSYELGKPLNSDQKNNKFTYASYLNQTDHLIKISKLMDQILISTIDLPKFHNQIKKIDERTK